MRHCILKVVSLWCKFVLALINQSIESALIHYLFFLFYVARNERFFISWLRGKTLRHGKQGDSELKQTYGAWDLLSLGLIPRVLEYLFVLFVRLCLIYSWYVEKWSNDTISSTTSCNATTNLQTTFATANMHCLAIRGHINPVIAFQYPNFGQSKRVKISEKNRKPHFKVFSPSKRWTLPNQSTCSLQSAHTLLLKAKHIVSHHHTTAAASQQQAANWD